MSTNTVGNNNTSNRSSTFIEDCVKTESRDFAEIQKRMNSVCFIRLLHGGIGCTTEAGELMDAIKKWTFYGKEIDKVNIKEELGDLFWYIALICSELNFSFEEIQELVIKKLKTRYPEKYSNEAALNRNLEDERRTLEGNK